MNHLSIHQLGRISPISDADAARAVQASTLADLAGQITAAPVMAESRDASPGHGPTSRASRASRRRRLALIGIAAPVISGVAAAAVILAASGQSQPVPVKPSHPGVSQPAKGSAAQLTAALAFTTSGGYLTVKVVNPLADASRYRAEFARHHLNISLTLVPASPSLVGTLVYFGGSPGSDITPITAQGKCYTGGGGSACPVGVRIPLSFRGQAQIVFGRAARPGEQYETTASATAPGEIMHGMSVDGLTVARVLAMLRQRHITVPVYSYDDHNYGKLLHHVPGNWYVYDAVPRSSQQVTLFVGPTWPRPVAPPPAAVTPKPSPTTAG